MLSLSKQVPKPLHTSGSRTDSTTFIIATMVVLKPNTASSSPTSLSSASLAIARSRSSTYEEALKVCATVSIESIERDRLAEAQKMCPEVGALYLACQTL